MVHQVGRYRVDGLIGEGAMADVYQAFDPEIGRVVAIKLLKPDLRRDAEVVRRFLRESNAAGILSHSHIATIYDVGEAEGIPYIAMEHIDGRPLDVVLQEQGRFVSERVVALAMQVADALAYAHRQGIVHRDIKPSNIMLADGGRKAKLLDFGIARILHDDEERAEREATRTQAGQVIGTPRYMSPEQALGLPLDHRSDLFSLGVVLYEMVTGKVAFAGTGLADVAIKVAQKDPDPIDAQISDCSRGLRFIIAKLMAKKPEQRFADADQLRLALAREHDAMTTEEPALRRGLALRFKLPLALGAITALVLALSVGAVLARQTRTLEQLALTSGSSITAFVTSNAALYVAENAGLPADQQDWLPLQAFVDSAAEDANVSRLIVVDDRGVVRAASNKRLIGTRHVAPAGEPRVTFEGRDTVTKSATSGSEGFRFVRPIRYAGAQFGKVDMVLRRTALDAAATSARNLLIMLSLVMSIAVLLIGATGVILIARPIRRIRQALEDAAAGNLAFRISHRQHGEFGRLFDAFNRMAAALEERTSGRLDSIATQQALTRTRIADPVAPKTRRAA